MVKINQNLFLYNPEFQSASRSIISQSGFARYRRVYALTRVITKQHFLFRYHTRQHGQLCHYSTPPPPSTYDKFKHYDIHWSDDKNVNCTQRQIMISGNISFNNIIIDLQFPPPNLWLALYVLIIIDVYIFSPINLNWTELYFFTTRLWTTFQWCYVLVWVI